ncbi:MAG TPA: nucleotide exchange factor GrpE [Acidimicrobiales bacterium]|nr:nucleotide exchange factor GrpE [Acidimicrobiales bacterium]
MTGEDALAERDRDGGADGEDDTEQPGPEAAGAEPELEPGSPGGSGLTEQEGGVAEATVAPGAGAVDLVAAERDEYLDALRRLQADFENFRKRTARQQAETFDRASEAVIERLLPALDALDLALAHAGEKGEPPTDLEVAFAQIGNLLRDVLAKEGLERIDSTGVAFDPTVHDAVAHVPAGEEDGVATDVSGPAVVETLRTGYRLKGRVLRPAMVKVRA